jgi:hypothetical protein
MKGSESHAGWFAEQLKTRQGDLADAQLFTLFLWSHAQWSRERQHAAVPLGKDGLQFGRYQESRWPEGQEGETA